MPAFVTASNVRSFAGITNTIADPWSEGNLGSNIRAASAFLQRATGRQFELTPALATLVGLDGTQAIDWRYATPG